MSLSGLPPLHRRAKEQKWVTTSSRRSPTSRLQVSEFGVSKRPEAHESKRTQSWVAASSSLHPEANLHIRSFALIVLAPFPARPLGGLASCCATRVRATRSPLGYAARFRPRPFALAKCLVQKLTTHSATRGTVREVFCGF